MKCEDAQELITALVDDELASEDRLSIESHLRECRTCRFIQEQESALKSEIQAAGARVTAPPHLREKILAGYRGFPAGRETEGRSAAWSWLALPGFRPALALIVLVTVLFPAIYLWWPAGNISLAALKTHEGILGGKTAFVRAENPDAVKSQLVHSVAGRFAPMGYDLSTMKLRVVGGMVQKVRERKVLVTVYEGEGPAVTCFTFLGSEKDAPKSAKIFFDPEKQISFYTFSDGDVHGVFHREGDVICILVSKMPMADLLAVARTKARPA
jgi:anti-sigma factor RsiW